MNLDSQLLIFDAALIQLVATAAMTGIIWLVQLVHYPMFAGIDQPSFLQWHEFHSRRITYIVAPLMLAELVLSAYLSYELTSAAQFSVFFLALMVWASTFFLSVPLHNRLGQKHESTLIEALIKTNWPRTIAYSLKLALASVVALTCAVMTHAK